MKTEAEILNDKANEAFDGSLVRKDLAKRVKGNAIVPTYVLEFLLASYSSSRDENAIEHGIHQVLQILERFYVHRNEAELVKSKIEHDGTRRIIDHVTVKLNEKENRYEATFLNLGLKGVPLSSGIVRENEKLLVGGIWAVIDVSYEYAEGGETPWRLDDLTAVQMANFDFDEYVSGINQLEPDEWMDLLIHSIGFDPEKFGRRAKLLQLLRLVPYVERNYNLVELGPKGTGKSHIYSELSPHGILISGGEVTVPKLFVNMSTGKIGLVGYWDVVAFDEFAGKQKKTNKELVDIMKNYMANKSFSRGSSTLSAEASLVFVGNTSHSVPHMLKHSDLFEELPQAYHDPAFLDRLHAYLPGWEVETIRSEMFSTNYGFVVDILAEALRYLRNLDYSEKYREFFELGSSISTRDRDGIHKTFSGMMKLLHPDGHATEEEIKELLEFAIEGRKRVKDQILRIDTTMSDVEFTYKSITDSVWHVVETLEQREHPDLYTLRSGVSPADASSGNAGCVTAKHVETTDSDLELTPEEILKQRGTHVLQFRDGQTGFSFEKHIIPYLHGAKEITVVDPYIRQNHQGRNLVELLGALIRDKSAEDEINIVVVTVQDKEPEYVRNQIEMLEFIKENSVKHGIFITVSYVPHGQEHDRYIRADTGWRVILGRGLDVFHKPSDNWLDYELAFQEARKTRGFNITYELEGSA